MTTVTLRPNGTISAPTSIVPSGTAHAALSDDSDSTYITSTVSNFPEFNLGTFTLPAGAVTSQGRCRVRGRTDSGTGTYSYGYFSSYVNAAFTTTIAESVGAWSVMAGLPQSAIDALVVGRRPGFPGVPTHRLMELYFDLMYVAQPVVTLNAITDPYTAGSQIACSWTNTLDSDGGAQTAYQLWVTDDNDSNAVVYDSGVVVSAATSANTGPLVNGGEYTVHIKVAQTVNGAYHWSAEDTQADVDLSVTTVDVSSVAAVATDSTASITVTVSRDLADGAWEFVEVERTIDGGITWQPVRGSSFVAPTGADTHVAVDYWAPNSAVVDYRARATYYSSGVPITGAWVETASPATWESGEVWFKVPGSPNLNDTFCFKMHPSAGRYARRGVFHVLGASAPVAVSDARSTPTWRCVVQTETEAEADALLDILSQPVVLIQTPPAFKRFGSRYCSIGDDGEDPVSPQVMALSGYAVWSFDATEVAEPGDPDAGTM